MADVHVNWSGGVGSSSPWAEAWSEPVVRSPNPEATSSKQVIEKPNFTYFNTESKHTRACV